MTPFEELTKVARLTHHGDHPLGRFNAWVAVKMTEILSSMFFFWFCVLLDSFEAYSLLQQKFDPVAWVTFIAQTVIQLLALPLLGASQKIIQISQDARADADHRTLVELKELNDRQFEILEAIRDTRG